MSPSLLGIGQFLTTRPALGGEIGHIWNEENTRKTYSQQSSGLVGGPSGPVYTKGPMCMGLSHDWESFMCWAPQRLSGPAYPLVMGSGQAHLSERTQPALAFPFSLGSQTS